MFLSRIHGGVFFANGHLYLVSHSGSGDFFDLLEDLFGPIDSVHDGDIIGFDGSTCREMLHTNTDCKRGVGEELEGITIRDFESPSSPNPPHIQGQINGLMIDNDT